MTQRLDDAEHDHDDGHGHGHGHGHRVPIDRSDPGGKVAEHQRHGVGVKRVPYPIRVRRLSVLRQETLTPRIVRLTLGGPGIVGFQSFRCDDHVKVVFADPDGTRRDPTPRDDRPELHWPRPLPRTRSYTVRRYDADAGELDLDVVVHDVGATAPEDQGLGSAWARQVAIGDTVVVAGPPGAEVFAHRGHHVLAGDETALPAFARWIEEAPPEATADVVVEAGERSDLDYPLPEHAGVRVHRQVRGSASRLHEAVAGLARPDAFVFAAGEADAVRPLRRAARDGLAEGVLVTGYWKRGVVDHDED